VVCCRERHPGDGGFFAPQWDAPVVSCYAFFIARFDSRRQAILATESGGSPDLG